MNGHHHTRLAAPPALKRYTDQCRSAPPQQRTPRRTVRWAAVFWLAHLGAWALVPLVWWLLR